MVICQDNGGGADADTLNRFSANKFSIKILIGKISYLLMSNKQFSQYRYREWASPDDPIVTEIPEYNRHCV